MMKIMRGRIEVVVGLVGLLGVGCAHSSEVRETTVSATTVPETREVVAVEEPVVVESDAPRARPRLTQTITLGQSNGELTYTAPAQAGGQQAAGGNTSSVVVNNHVVVNQPPVYYGGYGGYGGYGAYGARSYARSDGFARDGRSAAWGSHGFEGPRRTAAPGQTPGVGGNWAPAPSYGPAPMK
jgi:hypothetical protein